MMPKYKEIKTFITKKKIDLFQTRGRGCFSSNHIVIAWTSVLLNILLVYYAFLFLYKPKIITWKKININETTQSTFLETKITLTSETIRLTPNNNTRILKNLEQKMYPNLRNCSADSVMPLSYQKGNFWVLKNYIPRESTFECNRSITLATHADYTYLDNLDLLASRWQGPVSLAVYCPGTDFNNSIEAILYLRSCGNGSVKQFVNFHLFFHMDHMPKIISSTKELLETKIDCNENATLDRNNLTYRHQKKLTYPVNVARNIARSNSDTYFSFSSDIQLYPSVNIIPEFLKMLKKPDSSNTSNPRVYVLPLFEVASDHQIPKTKEELQTMLRLKQASVCSNCHVMPKAEEWKEANGISGLSVFHVAKREKEFKKWEPFYIGTDREPIYDERLSWEGKGDKITQMYIMCVKGYEFHILDNAFLVHKPGTNSSSNDNERKKKILKQYNFIISKIYPEYKTLFGKKKGCVM